MEDLNSLISGLQNSCKTAREDSKRASNWFNLSAAKEWVGNTRESNTKLKNEIDSLVAKLSEMHENANGTDETSDRFRVAIRLFGDISSPAFFCIVL